MANVFLSYSSEDYFFAELAEIKLSNAGISLWRDQGQLRAGNDWRQGIEKGISDSLAVLVALSTNSSESSYVTYEWAYALGQRKPIIPLKLNECLIHPKLETIQYLDFSVSRALPWASLIGRIQEIESDIEPNNLKNLEGSTDINVADLPYIKAILAYLNQRGYQMASFDRLCQRIGGNLTEEKLKDIVARNPTVLHFATLAGGKPGVAKVVP